MTADADVDVDDDFVLELKLELVVEEVELEDFELVVFVLDDELDEVDVVEAANPCALGFTELDERTCAVGRPLTVDEDEDELELTACTDPAA